MIAKSFGRILPALTFLLCVSPAAAQDQPAVSVVAIKNIEMRLTEVEDQMRILTGKVEKSDYLLRRINQAIQKMQEDNELRFTVLERAPKAVASPPRQVGGSFSKETAMPSRVTGTLGEVKIREGKVMGAVSNPSSPPLPKTPADYGLTPREMYDRAFGLLRQANYERAETAFDNFVDKYPDDKLVNNAKYWYAETYYVRGLFGDAAVAFAEAYQHNPSGSKASDSLLKLAMSLAGVEKIKDACSTLQALKKKYPKASSTIKDRAKEEWGRLKCK